MANPSREVDHVPNDDSNKESQTISHSYWTRSVNTSLTSIPIILCCFVSGLVDSCVFNAWGVFATMQTGNTIILALGASSQPRDHPIAWLQALLAVLFFFLGSFFASRVGHVLHPLRHTTLAMSFLLQAVLICTAAALVQAHVAPGLITNGQEYYIQLVPLPMLSFQGGMQSVTARQLGLNEIPTTVLTSIYCDLGNDENLFLPFTQNWKRNRRLAAAVSLLIGAIAGGWLSRTSGGMPAALWMAAGVKASLSITWLVWRSE